MSITVLLLPVLLTQAIGLVFGIIIVVGAVKMMRLKSHGLATVASILALFLCGPASLLGLPMGIWSLVVLNRRHVKTAFQAQGAQTGTDPVSLPAKNAAIELHLVQAPADCLLLAAGIAFVTACGVAMWLLAAPASSVISSLIRGGLTTASVTLATYSLFVGVAGLMLRRLRARLFVLLVVVVVGLFLPAAVALNVVMEFRNMPEWPVAIPLWLGMPAALWVVVTLFRDDVRRAFDAAGRASLTVARRSRPIAGP